MQSFCVKRFILLHFFSHLDIQRMNLDWTTFHSALPKASHFGTFFPKYWQNYFLQCFLFLPYSSVGRLLIQVVPCPQSAISAPAITLSGHSRGEHKGLFVRFPRDSYLYPILDAQNATPGLLAKAAPPPSYSTHHFTAQKFLSSEFVLNQFSLTVSLQTGPGEWNTSPVTLLLHSRAAFPSESDEF